MDKDHWDKFFLTGKVDDYLKYRNCSESSTGKNTEDSAYGKRGEIDAGTGICNRNCN